VGHDQAEALVENKTMVNLLEAYSEGQGGNLESLAGVGRAWNEMLRGS